MKYRIVASILMLIVFACLVALRAQDGNDTQQPVPAAQDQGAKFE